jgi:hypothetical protein
MNWGTLRTRSVARRQGTVDVDDMGSLMAPLLRSAVRKPPRRRLSKAELRQIAADALARSGDVPVTRCPPGRRS